MPIDQPKPLPTAVTGLVDVAFRTALDKDKCKTPAFFASIPFDRATGKDPSGAFMNGLNDMGIDRYGYDRQGFNDMGINRNGYDKSGKFSGDCKKLHEIPKIPGAE